MNRPEDVEAAMVEAEGSIPLARSLNWPTAVIKPSSLMTLLNYITTLEGKVERLPPALQDVAAERRRQVEVKGWTFKHDDNHLPGDLCRAAASYAYEAGRTPQQRAVDDGAPPLLWPWAEHWWKPSTPRRDLIKAAAMIVAEIERLDRAALQGVEG